ncbi:MAG: glycerol-3-phosphate dehydrogenase/oxidase [Solirubrobacterales bacterium]
MITRDSALAALSGERFDVVVIGGGVTGAGVALDAASRGYSTAIVERDDWAIGTSSRSSKMVHGGLRYLQNFDLGLVREALLERQLMVHLAPHLVYPTPYLVPQLGDDRRDVRVGIGLNMYDVMATTRVGQGRRQRGGGRRERERVADLAGGDVPPESWAPDRHRTIPGEEVVEMIPALASREPRSAYLFYDCQTDDVRLVLTILGEAERYGAVMANRLEVTSLLERNGKADGVVCRCGESGATVEIQADNVINATGVWADRIRPDEILDETEVPRIAPSRGTHLTLPLEKLPLEHAACIVPAGSGRTIFVLPWYGRVLVGTTDNDYDGDIDHVRPGGDDIDYLLDAVNSYFETELGRGDLTGAYAGVRPLISTGDPKKSVDISRKAELYETSSGLLTITGGKLTTWRRMAKLVVDRVAMRDGSEQPCRTTEVPVGMAAREEDLAPPDGVDAGALPEGYAEQLAFRYGHASRAVLAVAAERPELAAPIVEGRPDLLAEVVIAARREQARSLADVLLRRTRLGILAAPQLRTAESVAAVAAALGGELGWSEDDIRAAAEAWPGQLDAEGADPAASA